MKNEPMNKKTGSAPKRACRFDFYFSVVRTVMIACKIWHEQPTAPNIMQKSFNNTSPNHGLYSTIYGISVLKSILVNSYSVTPLMIITIIVSHYAIWWRDKDVKRMNRFALLFVQNMKLTFSDTSNSTYRCAATASVVLLPLWWVKCDLGE